MAAGRTTTGRGGEKMHRGCLSKRVVGRLALFTLCMGSLGAGEAPDALEVAMRALDVLAAPLFTPGWQAEHGNLTPQASEFEDLCLPLARRLAESAGLDQRIAAVELCFAGDGAEWADLARRLLKAGPDEVRQQVLYTLRVKTLRRLRSDLVSLLADRSLRPYILEYAGRVSFPRDAVIGLVDREDAEDLASTARYVARNPCPKGSAYLKECLLREDHVAAEARPVGLEAEVQGPWRLCDLAALNLMRWECKGAGTLRGFPYLPFADREAVVARLRRGMDRSADTPTVEVFRSIVCDRGRPIEERCTAAEQVLRVEVSAGEEPPTLVSFLHPDLEAEITQSLVEGAPEDARQFTPEVVRLLLRHPSIPVQTSCLAALSAVEADLELEKYRDECHRGVWEAVGHEGVVNACSAAVLGLDHGAMLTLIAMQRARPEAAGLGRYGLGLLHDVLGSSLRWFCDNDGRPRFSGGYDTSESCAKYLLDREMRAALRCPVCAAHQDELARALGFIRWD